MTFAEKISAERKKRSVPQSEVAKVVGVSQTAISYFESGEKFPSAPVIKRLAKYYGVSMDYLMDNEG